MLKAIIFITAAVAFGYYAYINFDDAFGEDVAVSDAVDCTADAKQCPDGSYVGRSGLECQFVCPGE